MMDIYDAIILATKSPENSMRKLLGLRQVVSISYMDRSSIGIEIKKIISMGESWVHIKSEIYSQGGVIAEYGDSVSIDTFDGFIEGMLVNAFRVKVDGAMVKNGSR